MNFLFVCSKNQWRSRTAETIFKNKDKWQVKSAGTSSSARIRISQQLINWADLIFVMEDHHKKRIIEKYQSIISQKEMIVLDIPDEYQYMDEELVFMLEEEVPFYVTERINS